MLLNRSAPPPLPRLLSFPHPSPSTCGPVFLWHCLGLTSTLPPILPRSYSRILSSSSLSFPPHPLCPSPAICLKLSSCPPTCSPFWLPYKCLSTFSHAYLSTSLSTCPDANLSTCLPVYPPIYTRLATCPVVYQSACPSRLHAFLRT